MMRFKPASLLLAAALTLPLGAAATETSDAPCKHEHSHKHHHDRHADRHELIKALFASWELSDEQRETLSSARENMIEQAKKLKDQQFDDRQSKREAFRALRDEHRQMLEEVLSDKQLTVLELLMNSRHHKPPKR